MANPFGRLSKRMKKGMETLLTPAEDPRQTHVSSFERQRGLLVKVQTALDEVSKAKSRLEAKAADTRAKLPQLEELARQALREEREDLARLRLQRRQLASIELQGLEKQLLEIEREEHRLSLTEQRLSSQLTAFYTRQELIAARYSAAEAQVHIGEALSGVSGELAELNQAMDQMSPESYNAAARSGINTATAYTTTQNNSHRERSTSARSSWATAKYDWSWRLMGLHVGGVAAPSPAPWPNRCPARPRSPWALLRGRSPSGNRRRR